MSDRSPNALYAMLRKLGQHVALSDVETAALLALPQRRAVYERSSYFIREGQANDHVHILLSGYAHRHKITRKGTRQILTILLRDDIFDLLDGLEGASDHDIQALTRCEVAMVPRGALAECAERFPGIAHALMRDCLADSALFRRWMVNLGRGDARQRVAHLVCELALRQAAAGLGEAPFVPWPLTQEHIADATGLTSVHVNRTLQAMRADRLIETPGQKLRILSWPRLERIADFDGNRLLLQERRSIHQMLDVASSRRPSEWNRLVRA